MDPKKLPHSILVALGLTAVAATQSGCVLGPCLDVPAETDSGPEGTDSDSDSDSTPGPTWTLPLSPSIRAIQTQRQRKATASAPRRNAS